MLENTFLHLPGVGRLTEDRLWKSGVVTWPDYDSRFVEPSLFELPGEQFDSPLRESREALRRGDATFFATQLPRSEHYRIALTFPQETIFVDIETTGLSRWYDYITVVGWEMGGRFGVHVKDAPPEQMYEAFAKAKAIVTFNGTMFDIPFLKKEFPNLPIPDSHIDLRFFSRRTSISGGQKAIEQTLGIERPSHLTGIVGESAPVLWYGYRWGDLDSLKLLIEYNHSDIQGLKQIMDIVVDRFLLDYGFPVDRAQIPRFYTMPSNFTFDETGDIGAISLTPYAGNPGPAISYPELRVKPHLKVVGIDLTGSEERPSGWCLLTGHEAITERIGTDEELIRRTLGEEPHLVSIDSPLSLPRGRNSVDDSDPSRHSHGIMRECERVLKKRGVSVYPCLIPSMQKLTERGIRLADSFRKLGIPVIESYPGAAQDILGIPRKRASLKYLKDGLVQFGIRGAFEDQEISHDELDAITSALVGIFFMDGRFEALGNEDEEYLIIPDVSSGADRWGNIYVIGLSGPIASGKTTAGRMLENMGFHYCRYSQTIAEIGIERDLEPTRENLQMLGQDIFAAGGQRALGRRLLATMPAGKNLVIDGLRHPEDVAFLFERFGPTFLHVHIDSATDLRRQRYMSLGFRAEDFDVADDHNVEHDITDVRSRATLRIQNNNSIQEYNGLVANVADAKSYRRVGVS